MKTLEKYFGLAVGP